MTIWTQISFLRGGGIEKQHSSMSLSIGLNVFCERSEIRVSPGKCRGNLIDMNRK